MKTDQKSEAEDSRGGLRTEKMTVQEREAYEEERSRIITRVGTLSICLNILFAVIKFIIGTLSHSVAIITDAVNNATDSVSSAITVLGIKLAGHRPTKNHPLGFGEVEYLSTLTIGGIILITGYEFLRTSISRIMHPELTHVTALEIVIILGTILMKILIGRLDKKYGREYDSGSLIASGSDAYNDCFASALTILAALAAMIWKIDIDGWVGLIISLIIIWTGIESLREATNSILGTRPNEEVCKKVMKIVMSYPPIGKAYNLVLYNFGPTSVRGTMDVEIPYDVTMEKAFIAMNNAERAVFDELGIELTLGAHAVNYLKPEYNELFEKIKEKILSVEDVEAIYGFNYEEQDDTIDFNVIVSFDNRGEELIRKDIVSGIHEVRESVTVHGSIYLNDMTEIQDQKNTKTP